VLPRSNHLRRIRIKEGLELGGSCIPNPKGFPASGPVFRAAIGYFAAAAACTVAGYSIFHEGRFPLDANTWVVIGALWLLLYPIFRNQATYYDQLGVKPAYAELVFREGIYPSVRLTLAAWITCLTALYAIHETWEGVWRLLLAVVPGYVLVAHRTSLWPKPPTDRRRDALLAFRHRCFFPVLATSVPSFLYGALSADFLTLIVADILILLLWGYSLVARRTLHLTRLGVVSLTLIALPAVLNPDSLSEASWSTNPQVQLFTASILAIAIGITEAWRSTSRILGGAEITDVMEYSLEFKALCLGGTNVAVAVSGPLCLLMYVHPMTTRWYLAPMILLVICQTVAWLAFDWQKKYQKWWWISTGMSVLLPLAVSWGAIGTPPTVSADSHFGRDLISVSVIFTGCIYFETSHQVFRWMAQSHRNDGVVRFSNKGAAYAMTGAVATILAGVTLVGHHLLDPSWFSTKLAHLQLVYASIAFACGCAVFIQGVRDEEKGQHVPQSAEYETPRPF
jgi:hypothetical protein